MNTTSFATSSEAYHWALENNVVSERMAQVLQALTESNKPMNQTVAYHWICDKIGKPIEKYSISPRFAVLLRMGLIREAGTGPCPVTGRTTVFYSPTLQKPTCTMAEAMKAGRTSTGSVQQLKKELAEANVRIKQLEEMMALRQNTHRKALRRIEENPLLVQLELPNG